MYNEEFLANLIKHPVNKKDRFKPVLHKKLKENDIVLIKEENMKRINLLLGIVKKIISNGLGEVTAAEVRKGRKNEIVKRHVSSLIPVLSSDPCTNNIEVEKKVYTEPKIKKKIAAALQSRERPKALYQSEEV